MNAAVLSTVHCMQPGQLGVSGVLLPGILCNAAADRPDLHFDVGINLRKQVYGWQIDAPDNGKLQQALPLHVVLRLLSCSM